MWKKQNEVQTAHACIYWVPETGKKRREKKRHNVDDNVLLRMR